MGRGSLATTEESNVLYGKVIRRPHLPLRDSLNQEVMVEIEEDLREYGHHPVWKQTSQGDPEKQEINSKTANGIYAECSDCGQTSYYIHDGKVIGGGAAHCSGSNFIPEEHPCLYCGSGVVETDSASFDAYRCLKCQKATYWTRTVDGSPVISKDSKTVKLAGGRGDGSLVRPPKLTKEIKVEYEEYEGNTRQSRPAVYVLDPDTVGQKHPVYNFYKLKS